MVACLGSALLAMSSLAAPSDKAPLPPSPPRLLADGPYPSVAGREISVRALGNFQAALDGAEPGDVISLEAGATYRGNFVLPKKSRAGWIVIRSTREAALPPGGMRISPASVGAMPKLVTPNGAPVVQTAPGAHGYRFIGVEFTLAENVRSARQIVAFGGTQSDLSDTPFDLVLDRCYIHGHALADVFRGVLLNSASSAITNSHLSEIHVVGHDSQAILGYNGPGPFRILNNYLEAAGENVMFGGGDPNIPNLIPSDIEIRHNHLFKPLRWRRASAERRWTVKNILELKNAQRVLIEGNVLENVWADGQGGAALVLTPRSGGAAPWSVVQDVMFRHNIVRNAEGGFGGQSVDDGHKSQPLRRVAVVNNLWVNVEKSLFTMAVPGIPVEDLIVDHNTAIPTRQFSYDLDASIPPGILRFQFTNNVTGYGRFGVKFPRTRQDVARWLPGATIASNALVQMGSVSANVWDPDQFGTSSPVGFYSTFPDATLAGLGRDGVLLPGSPLIGAGTDGKDLGVDFAALRLAIRGASL